MMNNNDALGYYAELNLNCYASAEDIKQNYRELAKKWHPDHNQGEEALTKFKKISVAYDVLKDDNKRLNYDLLSTVYPSAKYPDVAIIKPFSSSSGSSDIKSFLITNVRGKLFSFSVVEEEHVCSYAEAIKIEFSSALCNWLFGWWHPKAFVNNVRALIYNFRHVDSRSSNLKLFIHNAVAYQHEDNEKQSLLSAYHALSYANAEQKKLLHKFIENNNQTAPVFPAWNNFHLRLVQLVVPFFLFLISIIPLTTTIVSESDLMNMFHERKKISYNQEVRFNNGGTINDDMVVAKVVNIPVDLSDNEKLYHLKSSQNVMYGPSDDFDIIRQVSAGTTVRITGYSPDNIWSRIMLDEGEIGFVHQDSLQQGIGNKIPYDSKIIAK